MGRDFKNVGPPLQTIKASIFIMYFPCLVYLIIAIHEINHAHSESNNLNIFNDDDGVDLETPIFSVGNGGDDTSLTADDAIKQQLTSTCIGTIDQEDFLSASSSSSNTNLFVRDRDQQDHEQCLPPVNIGADVLNLWKDPLFELERQSTPTTNGDKTPDATKPLGDLSPGPGPGPGPGPEGPKIPTLLAPFDHSEQSDQSNDLESDQPVWNEYEGRENDKSGFGTGSFGSERLEDYDIDTEIDDEDYNPCKAPWRPDGYKYDLCCNGQAFLSRQVTEWKYDAVDSCDLSEFVLLLETIHNT